jgi:RHS repeat-associated protein
MGRPQKFLGIDDSTTHCRIFRSPFGEELFAGIGIRSAALGYGGDSTRQKFTGKERDDETGLDFFGARYFASVQGRFTSADPLLSSGTIYDPQSWNRYTYTLNYPLKYTDPFGLYVFADGTDDEYKKKFRQGLKDLQSARDSFKKGSNEYNRLDRALNAYGKEGVDNGVMIKFGATKGGSPADTAVSIALDPTGANKAVTANNPAGQAITVTIDPKQHSSANDYVTSIGHEGSHVADGSALVGALPTSLTDGAAVQAILGGPLNLTKYVTETAAYEVTSFIVQGRGAGTLAVGPKGGNQYEIWNAGWKETDRATKRAAGIDKVLAEPKSNRGLYEVTPAKPGSKLIE